MKTPLKSIFCMLTLAGMQACHSGWPEWFLKEPHAISPDGKAAVSSFINQVDEKYKVSVMIYVNGIWTMVGSGIFDYYYHSPSTATLYWESDSTVIILYPEDADIVRQEQQSYALGRTTHLVYRPMPATLRR